MMDGAVTWIDAVYDLLSSARRRHALYAIEEHGRLSVEQLARRIADREAAAQLEPEDLGTVKATLLHNHLPRLAAHDVVEYDETRKLVTTGSQFDELRETL